MSWGEVTLRRREREIEVNREFTCHPESGDLYRSEPSWSLRIKFCLVAIAIPFYTAGHIGHHVYTHLSSCDMKGCLWNVVSDIIYGISVFFAVLSGMAYPLVGRELEGLIENRWQGGVSNHLDYRRLALVEAQSFYLAYCFQKCGNIKDPGTTAVFRPAQSAS